MFTLLRKPVALGLSIFSLTLLAASAQATPFLPNVSNLDFLQYNGIAPTTSGNHATFQQVNPVGWTGGSGLIFIDAPGTADNGGYLSVYGPFPANSPVGGNFVEADGNPSFESGFSQTITGLTVGQTYTLSFYQAAGQQQGFTGATTEQWQVSLGTSAIGLNVSGGVGHVFNADPNATIATTHLMSTPSGGVTPWEYVSVQLTADATTDILSFLAWGDGGSTTNLPPMVFLSGVNSPDVLLPEPASLSLLAIGLLGLGASRMRKSA